LDSYKYRRRAHRPRLSHRSLDWQRNDPLGRSCFRPHLFEHRRQILRGFTKSDTDAYGDRDSDSYGYIHSDTNGYVHTYAYSNIDTYGHSHADSNGNTYCYCYCHSYAYFDTETFNDAETGTNA